MWFAPPSASAGNNKNAIPALEREVGRSNQATAGAAANDLNAVETPLQSFVDSPWRCGGSAIASVEDYIVAFDDVLADQTEAAVA